MDLIHCITASTSACSLPVGFARLAPEKPSSRGSGKFRFRSAPRLHLGRSTSSQPCIIALLTQRRYASAVAYADGYALRIGCPEEVCHYLHSMVSSTDLVGDTPVLAGAGSKAVRVDGGHEEKVHALHDASRPRVAPPPRAQPLRQRQLQLPAGGSQLSRSRQC